MAVDWHAGPVTRDTPLDAHYRNTQTVRRFLTQQCGERFHFSRPFMAWVKSGVPRTLGDVVDEWLRLNR